MFRASEAGAKKTGRKKCGSKGRKTIKAEKPLSGGYPAKDARYATTGLRCEAAIRRKIGEGIQKTQQVRCMDSSWGFLGIKTLLNKGSQRGELGEGKKAIRSSHREQSNRTKGGPCKSNEQKEKESRCCSNWPGDTIRQRRSKS